MAISNPSSFYEEARYQGACAVEGMPLDVKKRPVEFKAHHVVYKQRLRTIGIPQVDWYDTRNALRLTPRAHDRHHSGDRKVRTTELKNCNVDYAVEIFGAPKAVEYLRRYYDDETSPDPRLEELLAP